jgi:hypothetical protein
MPGVECREGGIVVNDVMGMAPRDTGHPAATSSAIDMGLLLARVRFAVLWVVVACALAGSFAVFFGEPGRLAEGVAGVMEGEPVTWGWAYVYAAMIGLPLALAAATLFLPARTSAIANLVVGVPLGAFGLFAMVSEVAGGALHPHVTLAAVGAAVAWLIVGLSIALLRGPSHAEIPTASAAGDTSSHGS